MIPVFCCLLAVAFNPLYLPTSKAAQVAFNVVWALLFCGFWFAIVMMYEKLEVQKELRASFDEYASEYQKAYSHRIKHISGLITDAAQFEGSADLLLLWQKFGRDALEDEFTREYASQFAQASAMPERIAILSAALNELNGQIVVLERGNMSTTVFGE